MGKFKPVAMPITFDQLQNEFKPMLKSLGLDVHGIFSGTTKYVVNIFNYKGVNLKHKIVKWKQKI